MAKKKQEKILATNENARKIAAKLGWPESDLEGFVKEVLIVIDAYERSYAANKLRPALTAEVFTGIRQKLELGVENLMEAGCNKAEPDPTLVKMCVEAIGEEAWNGRVAGMIYNRAAFDGFMTCLSLVRDHMDKTLQGLDTAG